MADHSKPTTASNYSTEFTQQMDARFDDITLALDPAYTTPTNLPTNAIRLNSASAKWERWNGSTWGDAVATYAIAISGNAGTATKWATGRTISLTGDVSGTSGSFDGSGSASITATLATVTAAKGGTGQAGGYAIGDLLYASGASALSKLAGVATGNALISGGVGAAPTWGKVTLTGHVSGILPVANGGTSFASYSIGDVLYASGTGTLAKLAAAASGNVMLSGTTPSWGKVTLTGHVSGTLPVANGGTGIATATAYAVLCGGTSGTGPMQSIAGVGTAGQVLTSNGAGFLPTFQDPPSFDATTRMLFQQTSPPSGWTKVVTSTYDDAGIRMTTGVAGTGGSVSDGFNTLFGASKSTASHTLTGAEIPAHVHTFTSGDDSPDHAHYVSGSTGNEGAHTHPGVIKSSGGADGLGFTGIIGSGSTGAGSAHAHSISFYSAGASARHQHSGTTNNNTGGGGGHTHTLNNMNLKFVDVILATKN